MRKEARMIKPEYNTKVLCQRLMETFEKHVGLKNSVGKQTLFKEINGVEYDEDDITHWLAWDKLKKAMSRVRTRSNCFITNYFDGDFRYFVLSTETEKNRYHQNLDRVEERLEELRIRSSRAVKEKWHKQEWKFE